MQWKQQLPSSGENIENIADVSTLLHLMGHKQNRDKECDPL